MMRALLGLNFAFLLSDVALAENFSQPIIWQDLADTDLIRVNDTYYYSGSNMHFSPGAEILRSYDLVNWDLQGGNVYNKGIYASSLRFHEATGTFYWIGCIQGTGKTYIYTAPNIEGPWTQTSIIQNYCYYDDGLLIDDDGTMYVSYGKWVANGTQAKIWVAELTSDLQNKQSQVVFNTTEEIGYVEGSRFYKINGTYYIWLTNPGVGNGQIMLKSSGGPFGPYDSWHRVLENNGQPVHGGSSPYQGAIVDTPEGKWWYIAFVNLWPGGRLPVLAPITWDWTGMPNVQFVNGDDWGSTYPYPLPQVPVTPISKLDRFSGPTLGPQYEWNHNPDDIKWSVKDGLHLETATITDDFFSAQNTLSHRILGPHSNATINVDYSSMIDGDRAGLVVFRYDAGWLGITKNGTVTTLQMVDYAIMNSTGGWHTTNTGSVVDSVEVHGGSIWLRTSCDISGSSGSAKFSYSTDGKSYIQLGHTHVMDNSQLFFVGARYGIFNFATKQLGGSVVVKSFEISA
ncbi:endo xylanase, putative [Talaromyces stipitatus ATCC 10500]|uniref:Endo xylanase, putative n=1 Tax=Talaromyces stipitatus (strain ATCC 10500 / CBS 375.48 / QM 6759 / NRRL 1006) TaxID=441959 RepID=B8MQ99_TALSN|nr:endo xylanase, putative [Talaromyces stipitatus ATCC 10500]EED13246.1 endo xylanase, putative [Talaromyces stipitatus ATCC 10500]